MSKWRNFVENNNDEGVQKIVMEIERVEKELDRGNMEISEELYQLGINIIETTRRLNGNDADMLYEKLEELDEKLDILIGKKFGAFMRGKRESLGITLLELRNRTRISQSYMSRVELAQRGAPNIATVQRIARAMNIPLVDFLEGAGIDLGIKSKDGTVSVERLLKNNKTSLQNMGKEMTDEQKEKLVDIIDYLSNAPWGEDKRMELLDVLSLVDDFKKSI